MIQDVFYYYLYQFSCNKAKGKALSTKMHTVNLDEGISTLITSSALHSLRIKFDIKERGKTSCVGK